MDFKTEVFQNPFIVSDACRVDAIFTVTGKGTAADQAVRKTLVEGLIIDTSGSMYGERIEAVKLAANRVIETMDADTFFFIVVFAHAARLVVPLTSASEPLLDAELQRCEGVFQCGCRGVGTDWKAKHLQKIARKLLGSATIQKGLEMREKGFYGEATKYLGRATKIAAQSGNEEKMRRLKKVVEVINAKEGTVQLKKFIAKADEMDLDLCSTRTKQNVSQGLDS